MASWNLKKRKIQWYLLTQRPGRWHILNLPQQSLGARLRGAQFGWSLIEYARIVKNRICYYPACILVGGGEQNFSSVNSASGTSWRYDDI